MLTIGTALRPFATRVMLLGSGELGKEVAIECQRLGLEVIAVDRYADAPAMHVAHRSHVINMLDGNALKAVIEQVIDDADYTVIARRDAPDAVVMSLDTFNGLMETVHLLKSPANAAHLARSIEQYRQGQVKQQDLVDAD